MHNTDLIPTQEEVARFVLSTLRHSLRVEYYLNVFDIGHSDPQRPHDIYGNGNKFEWGVLGGLAMETDVDSDLFKQRVLPAMEIHRHYQHHHRIWNNATNISPEDGLRIGALDALCSYLDSRYYNGEVRAFDDLQGVINESDLFKRPWLSNIYHRMKKSGEIILDDVTLDNIPNVGISSLLYEKIVDRVVSVREMLHDKVGYDI